MDWMDQTEIGQFEQELGRETFAWACCRHYTRLGPTGGRVLVLYCDLSLLVLYKPIGPIGTFSLIGYSTAIVIYSEMSHIKDGIVFHE